MSQLICPACLRGGEAARCPTDGRIRVEPAILEEVATDPLLGRVFAKKYRVVDVLGTGGFGRVYRAVDETVDRSVAVKVIRDGPGLDLAHLRARFYREAKVLARVESDACVPLYEYGECDGTLFMAMQYLDGASLAGLIRHHGRIPPRRAVDIALQVLTGLAAAHAKGLIHRDIKPGNIMVIAGPLGDDRVKLLDFGIAKVQREDMTLDGVQTHEGAVLGSPAYMAPEQATAAPTLQSDLYAVGVVLFEMLTGRRPFEAPHVPGLLMAHQFEAVPPLMEEAGVDERLRAVVYRALEKRPERRWASAIEMMAALRRVQRPVEGPGFAETVGTSARQPAAGRAPSPSAQAEPVVGGTTSTQTRGEISTLQPAPEARGRWSLGALGLTALLAAGAGAWLWTRPPPGRTPLAVGSSATSPDARPTVAPPAAPSAPAPLDAALDAVAAEVAAGAMTAAVEAARRALSDDAIDARALKLRLMSEARFKALRAAPAWVELVPPPAPSTPASSAPGEPAAGSAEARPAASARGPVTAKPAEATSAPAPRRRPISRVRAPAPAEPAPGVDEPDAASEPVVVPTW